MVKRFTIPDYNYSPLPPQPKLDTQRCHIEIIKLILAGKYFFSVYSRGFNLSEYVHTKNEKQDWCCEREGDS
jgi:hypothetical protein